MRDLSTIISIHSYGYATSAIPKWILGLFWSSWFWQEGGHGAPNLYNMLGLQLLGVYVFMRLFTVEWEYVIWYDTISNFYCASNPEWIHSGFLRSVWFEYCTTTTRYPLSSAPQENAGYQNRPANSKSISHHHNTSSVVNSVAGQGFLNCVRAF